MAAAHGGQAGLNVLHRVVKSSITPPVVEADDKKLILRVGGLDELQDRLPARINFESWTGEIENDADRNRRSSLAKS